MSLDAASIDLLSLMRPSRSPLGSCGVRDARRRHAELYARCGVGPPMLASADHLLNTADQHRFRVRVLRPVHDPLGVIVYLHGGGWALGSVDDYDAFARALAESTRCVVVLPDYRKAPRHPYPAAVEDSWTTLTWTEKNLGRLISSPAKPLLVAGDGAGGNLAAAITLRAMSRGGPLIGMQILLYPILDADFDRPSYRNAANQLLLTRETMIWFWNQYLPDVRLRRRSAEATPLHAASLAGVPPTLVISAEFDPLVDEVTEFAARLAASGSEVTHRCFAGQMHGFVTLINLLPTSAHVLRFLGWQVSDRLGQQVQQRWISPTR